MSIQGSDPFDTLLYQQGQIGAPLVEGGAGGADDLDVAQRSVTVGDVVPIVFGRRIGTAGGVLISPGATEARFSNNTSNEVTASYHLVLSEGQLDGVQVRDVFQRSCRVGSFTQSYNRRAGSWTPGNVIVAREGFTKPEAPYYCGTGGTYEGMTTGSYVIANVPDGDSRWDRQVHLFIRGGMHVTRLIDDTLGPSNNICDLILWLLRRTSRTPEALIDVAAFEAAASFTDQMGLWCNGEFAESSNLEDFIASYGRYFLLSKTKRNGKIGLRPLLPVTSTGALDVSPIRPSYLFDEGRIVPGSFEITYVPLSERKLFCALMLWRQQPEDDIGIIRSTEVRYAQTAPDGPFEQHDLSLFATSENHAVKVGSYILARRRYVTHTLRIKLRPASYNEGMEVGDIVEVRLRRIASSSPAGTHQHFYEVDRIGKSRSGEITLDLVHFPVDARGRSLVAMDVAAAVGSGMLLSTGKTGVSCDVNADDDETEAIDDGLDPDELEIPLPDDDVFDVIIDGPDGIDPADPIDGGSGGGDFGTGGDFDDGFGNVGGGDGVGGGGGFDEDGNPVIGGGFDEDGIPVPGGSGPGGFDENGDPLTGGGFDENGDPVPAGSDDGVGDAFPDTSFDGSLGGSSGGGGGGGGGEEEGGEEEGGEEEGEGGEDIDGQESIPGVGGITPGGPIPGDTLDWPGCGCENSSIDWYRDGELVGNSRNYTITPADMNGTLVGRGKCDDIETCETPPIPVPVTPEAYAYWRFNNGPWRSSATTYGSFQGASSVTPTGNNPWLIPKTLEIAPPGTIAGGTLGQIVVILKSTEGIASVLYDYFGTVTVDSPFRADPGVWQFSNSNLDTGLDAWELEWTGEPFTDP